MSDNLGNQLINREMDEVNSAKPTHEGILKLHVDCLEHLAKFLSIKDLHALAHTCRRFKQDFDFILSTAHPMEMTIKVVENVIEKYRNPRYVKRVEFIRSTLNSEPITGIMKNLPHVEYVRVRRCEGDLYDDVLSHCRLNVSHISIESADASYKWLNQTYPKLKIVDFLSIMSKSHLLDLHNLFSLNENIKKFKISSTFLTQFAEFFKKTKHIVDELYICEYLIRNASIQLLCDIRGFFKSLVIEGCISLPSGHFCGTVFTLSQQYILDIAFDDFVSSLIPKITKIRVPIVLYRDWMKLAKDCRNILYIEAHTQHLVDVCRFFPKLKQVGTGYGEDESINLRELDSLRAKLPDAGKLSIYVPDEVYFGKQFKNRSNLKFVELKRHDSDCKVSTRPHVPLIGHSL